MNEVEGWKIKTYCICAPGREIETSAVQAALQRATTVLPLAESEENGFANRGLAILIVHFGNDGCWYLLDWWVHDCILKQRIFGAPRSSPTEIKEITDKHFMACVYELGVLDHERRFWIDLMMRGKPDPEAYLSASFEGEV